MNFSLKNCRSYKDLKMSNNCTIDLIRCKKLGCFNTPVKQGKYCEKHRTGKRCQEPNCTKGAGGKTDFCVAHGGGKRCQEPNCKASAIGKTDFCKNTAVVNGVKNLNVPRVQKAKLIFV